MPSVNVSKGLSNGLSLNFKTESRQSYFTGTFSGESSAKIDYLLTLADPAETEALAKGAGAIPMETFATASALTQRLQSLWQPGDRILFKASRAVALDQVVDQLKQFLLTD